MPKRTLVTTGAALAAVVALSACNSNAKELRDASLRTVVSKVGEGMFKNENHEIDGELACSTADGESYTITCKGRDTAEKPVRLVVSADSRQDLSSYKSTRVKAASIVGTVDGTVVFSQKCMGSAC